MSKVLTCSPAAREEKIKRLREMLPEGSRVYTLTEYSRVKDSYGAYYRYVRLFVAVKVESSYGDYLGITEITQDVAKLTGRKYNENHAGISYDGGGYSASDDAVQHLDQILYPEIAKLPNTPSGFKRHALTRVDM